MKRLFAYKNADASFHAKLDKAVPKLRKKMNKGKGKKFNASGEADTKPKPITEAIKEENIANQNNSENMNYQTALGLLKGSRDAGMRTATKKNHDLYINMHNAWVAKTGNSITFDDWMAQAHSVYGNRPNRAMSFDKWLACAVEQKLLNADASQQLAPLKDSNPPAKPLAGQEPKRILGMTPNVAIPVLTLTSMVLIFAFVKVFVLKDIQK